MASVSGISVGVGKTPMGKKRKHHKFSILVVGDTMTGKTALVRRYVSGVFKKDADSTIGIEYEGKAIVGHPRCQADLRLALWDMAGQRAFRNLIKGYYEKGDGCILVVDLGRRTTFENLGMWLKETKKLMDQLVPFIVVGNKSDLKDDKRVVSEEEMMRFVGEYSNMQYIEASALNGRNVNKIFETLALEIVKDKRQRQRPKFGGSGSGGSGDDFEKLEIELRKKDKGGGCGGCGVFFEKFFKCFG